MTSTTLRADPSSLDVLAADACEVIDLTSSPSGAFALIAHGADNGATTLLHLPLGGRPAPIEAPPIGSAVHEYGLNALAPTDSGVAALVKPGSAVAWLERGELRVCGAPREAGRLGDPVWAQSADVLIAASEQPRGDGFPSAALIALSADGASRTLWSSSDFVTRPAVSPSGRLAFMTWDLPWMPWERSHIQHGRLSPDATLTDVVQVCTPEGSAVAQPRFGPDGELYFLCDATGYFELWTCDGRGPRAVTRLGADIGLSLSRQTSRSYDFTASGAILAVVWRRGVSELVEIDPTTGAARRIETPEPPADLVAVASAAACYVTQPAEGPVSIRRIDSGGDQACWTAPAAHHAAPGPAPEHLHAVVDDGTGIDAFLFRAPAAIRKGLTVLNLHGGPKSLAPQRLKGPLRALRDAGYDIVELNYRGSAGYGRAFRDRLDGAWGVADVEDVLAMEQSLRALGLADRGRIVLRGGSAGGFTALNVVAREPGFAGAISYYGVSDLRRLGEATHKFESGYLKTLVGASDLADPVFAARSPITHAARIRAPVLLLQGADDKVNPPEQSLALARRITDAGGRCDVHLFAGEAHGFKRLDTLRACLELERKFLDALA